MLRIFPFIRLIVALLPFLCVGAQVCADQLLPAGERQTDFAADQLLRQSVIDGWKLPYEHGPLLLADSLVRRFRLHERTPPDKHHLRFRADGGSSVALRHAARSSALEHLRGTLLASPVSRLQCYASFSIDEALARSSEYTGKKWRGFAGEIEQAYAVWHAPRTSIFVGRFAEFWGDQQSLFLSARQGLDGFAYRFRWGRLTLSYRFASLNGENPDTDTVTEFSNRFFAGHRLDIDLGRSVRLGLMETVIYGGPGRQFDWAYLNPILFYHGSQLNEDVNDNTIIGFDLTCRPLPRTRLFAQFLLDDFQIDNEARGDQEPTEAALLVKADAFAIAPHVDLQASYTRVTNWTFNQIDPRNRYTHNDQLLGAAEGNDYDLSRLAVSRWLGEGLQSSLIVSYRRAGEGRVAAFWSEPWIADSSGNYTEPFPTGVVARTTELSLNLKGRLLRSCFVDLSAGQRWERNVDHQSGLHRTGFFAHLTIELTSALLIAVD